MASAYLSGATWIVEFRALSAKASRRVRIPAKQVPAVDNRANRKAAQAYADDCERTVRVLESTLILDLVERARTLKAITAADAARLRGEAPPPTPPPKPEILLAAERHPASQAEPLIESEKHRRWLVRFVTWAQISHPRQLTLALVERWIAHLIAEGYAWDSRRHALLWIRRACALGASEGRPDPLAGFRLDRRRTGQRTANVALDRSGLIRLLAALDPGHITARRYRDGEAVQVPDHRPRLAAALGAALGLRPSETFRLRVRDCDLDRQALSTGEKNEASVRVLPLPLILCQWLQPLLTGRNPDDLVFITESPRGARPFTATTWTQWLGPLLRTHTGQETIQAKSLRKTFATWAARDRWPAIELEAFLGHESSQVASITARHYLADYQLDELRPAALRIDRLLREALQSAAD